MSLVPILYTSLILFGILMVIIISFSYVAYKFKNRAPERVNEKNDYDYLDQPKYQHSYRPRTPSTIKVVPTIKNPELKKTTELPITDSRRTRESRTKVLTSEDMTGRKNVPAEYENSERMTGTYATTEMYRTNAGSYKKRVEVLNKVIPQEAPKEKFQVGGSGSIALPKYYENFRAIHYYTDDDDEYFYKPSSYYN